MCQELMGEEEKEEYYMGKWVVLFNNKVGLFNRNLKSLIQWK